MNAAGTVLGTMNYDPWGTPQTPALTPFGFTGELQQDANVYLRARWYQPGSGSFVTYHWDDKVYDVDAPIPTDKCGKPLKEHQARFAWHDLYDPHSQQRHLQIRNDHDQTIRIF